MRYNITERYYDNGKIDVVIDYAGNFIYDSVLTSYENYDEWKTTVDDYLSYVKQFKGEKDCNCVCTGIRPNLYETKMLLEIFNTVISYEI